MKQFITVCGIGLIVINLIGCTPSVVKKASPLSRLPAEIEIDYSWLGNKPYTLRHSADLLLSADETVYRGEGEYVIAPTGYEGESQTQDYQITLPVKQVKRLQALAKKVHWSTATKPGEEIQHADDYPNIRITLYARDKTPLEIFSTSNTPHQVPWNFRYQEDLLISQDTSFGDAVIDLTMAVKPQKPILPPK